MQERKIGNTLWVDLIDPSHEQLEQVVARFGLPPERILGCLDPEHLPQFEVIEDTAFLILRAYDLDQKSEEPSIRSLTRKVAIMVKPNLIITAHRVALTYLETLYASATQERRLLSEIILSVLHTYERAIDQLGDEFDDLEEQLFETAGRSPRARQLYAFKRRVTLLKRILRMTEQPLQDASRALHFRAEQHALDKQVFKLEEIYDNLIAVLSLQVSMSDQRTNDIMRVLTVYSIVFMPLNLITGIYGMNFEHMPELKWVHGYPMALTTILVIAVGILWTLKRRGWLGRSSELDEPTRLS